MPPILFFSRKLAMGLLSPRGWISCKTMPRIMKERDTIQAGSANLNLRIASQLNKDSRNAMVRHWLTRQ
jgi:hypothetical protein